MAACKSFLIILSISLPIFRLISAGDPDILTDFISPPNDTVVYPFFFTYTGIRTSIVLEPFPEAFKVTKASMAEFPALNGQSVSYAVLQYPSGSVNPVHIHPRAAELLFVSFGTLEVGFIDTTNKLFTQTLQKGDMFIFPKGLVHFQYNADPDKNALAISAFGSANAGTVSLPNAVFNSSVDDSVLAKSFKTDVATIQKLKAGLAPKP